MTSKKTPRAQADWFKSHFDVAMLYMTLLA
ncbi:hypothetical protein [Methylophilus sp. UBA6697]|nr:hypothetical protein [Methylophilus sp. UBA6697]